MQSSENLFITQNSENLLRLKAQEICLIHTRWESASHRRCPARREKGVLNYVIESKTTKQEESRRPISNLSNNWTSNEIERYYIDVFDPIRLCLYRMNLNLLSSLIIILSVRWIITDIVNIRSLNDTIWTCILCYIWWIHLII